MLRIRSYGPSLILLGAVVAALLAGPAVMRNLAYAQAQAQIQAAAERLENSRLAELGESFRMVARRVEPSVVHISVKKKISDDGPDMRGGPFESPEDMLRRFFERRGMPDGAQPRQPERRDQPEDDSESFRQFDQPRTIGNGSGWVYDTNGHIITNNHVVDNADVIEVKFNDGTTAEAEVIGTDPNTDIAVLKVDKADLHPAKLAETSLEQGDMVFAFGSPFRFDFSMSQGIVSGKGRQLGILGTSGYENFIQTDAAINPGNSGGPLTNIYGEVVGMNTAIATRTGAYNGLGFAIPVDMIRAYVPQLIDKGKVRRGFLGVGISDDPKLVRSFGVEEGVVIERVGPGLPADRAGLQRGDVIVELNGEPTPDALTLRSRVARIAPGSTVEVTVVRQGKRLTKDVELTEMPDEPTLGGPVVPDATETPEPGPDVDLTTLRKLGIESVVPMTQDLADQLDLPVSSGVLVERVRQGSVASGEGIGRGTVITHVVGQRVRNVKQLVEQIQKHDLADGVRLSVTQRMGRDVASRFVVLSLEE
jgi:serine protease Do